MFYEIIVDTADGQEKSKFETIEAARSAWQGETRPGKHPVGSVVTLIETDGANHRRELDRCKFREQTEAKPEAAAAPEEHASGHQRHRR